MVTKTCSKCNKEFIIPNNRKRQKFCSISCANSKGGVPIKFCEICNNEFKDYTNKTCSRECFLKLLSLKVKESHKDPNKNTERYKNIKKSLQIQITPEFKEKIEHILNLSYVKDHVLIIEKTGIKHSYKILRNYIECYPEEYEVFKSKMFPGPLTKKVQKLDEFQFKELLYDIQHFSYKFNYNKWNLNEKTLKRLFNFYIKTNDYLDKKETFPEKQVRRILEKNKIDYEREHYLVHQKYRCDFIIKNTKKIIEVNGDYWHVNPLIYGEDPKNYDNLQKDSLIRYNNKLRYYNDNNYNLLEVWESELDLNLDKVELKIIEYAKN